MLISNINIFTVSNIKKCTASPSCVPFTSPKISNTKIEVKFTSQSNIYFNSSTIFGRSFSSISLYVFSKASKPFPSGSSKPT